MFGIEISDSIAIESRSGGGFEIWQDNVVTLEVFLACRSQWRILAGFDRAVYLGLDYPGVEVVMRQLNFTENKTMFDDIQHMEWAALAVFNA
jgi:hypothetical protein